MHMVKMHPGLKQVNSETAYRLGLYEVDFPDGSLRFDVQATLCPEPECCCDNVQLTWLSSGVAPVVTWYTSDREYFDKDWNPLAEDFVHVFEIATSTDEFQQRYKHLMYLRRRLVLSQENLKPDEFKYVLPKEIMGEDADPGQGILGKVLVLPAKGPTPYAIAACDDENCYCSSLFVCLMTDDPDDVVFCVDRKNRWSQVNKNAMSKRLLAPTKKKLEGQEPFESQLVHMRYQRRLENYCRYVRQYEVNQQ